MRRFFENVGINVGVNVGVNLNAMERKILELILNDPALTAEKLSIEINKKYNFFEKIIPLEHSRYIMQYNSKNMETFFYKYLVALKNV